MPTSGCLLKPWIALSECARCLRAFVKICRADEWKAAGALINRRRRKNIRHPTEGGGREHQPIISDRLAATRCCRELPGHGRPPDRSLRRLCSGRSRSPGGNRKPRNIQGQTAQCGSATSRGESFQQFVQFATLARSALHCVDPAWVPWPSWLWRLSRGRGRLVGFLRCGEGNACTVNA